MLNIRKYIKIYSIIINYTGFLLLRKTYEKEEYLEWTYPFFFHDFLTLTVNYTLVLLISLKIKCQKLGRYFSFRLFEYSLK